MARPAGHARRVGVAGVPRQRVRRVVAAERELARSRLADDHAAGALQGPHEAAFGRHEVLNVDATAGGGRHPVDGEEILRRDRDSHQRTEIDASGQQRVDRAGLAHGAIGVEMGEGLQAGLERADAFECGLDKAGGRRAALSQVLRRLDQAAGKGESGQVHGVQGDAGCGAVDASAAPPCCQCLPGTAAISSRVYGCCGLA